MLSTGDKVKFVILSAQQYADLQEYDEATVYFITSSHEQRIAVGEGLFANYVPAACTAISLNYSAVTLAQNDTVTLIATTEPADPSDDLVWTSSNQNISITSTAFHNRVVITGITEGTSTVTCTCGEQSATCTFTVHEPYVYTEHILAENYSPNGAKFTYVAPISLTNGNYIEISIDISTVTGTKENILSVGQNISVWQGSNTGSRTHMYLTASNKTKLSVDLIQSALSRRPTYTLSGTTLLVKIDEHGVSLNGELFLYDTELRANPTLTYEAGMASFLALSSYDIGSEEGSNRSHAIYNYIKYYTTQYGT